MLELPIQQVWQLDMFPGGSKSDSFAAFMNEIMGKTKQFRDSIDSLEASEASAVWADTLVLMQWLKAALMEAGSFIACQEAQDLNDEFIKGLNGRLKQMNADFSSVLNQMDSLLLTMDEASWKHIPCRNVVPSLRRSLVRSWSR
jgi:oligoendopeptidase F